MTDAAAEAELLIRHDIVGRKASDFASLSDRERHFLFTMRMYLTDYHDVQGRPFRCSEKQLEHLKFLIAKAGQAQAKLGLDKNQLACYTDNMNTLPALGDKVSFKNERGVTLTGRVKEIVGRNVRISVRRSWQGGGWFLISPDKVTVEQRAGQVDPREHSDKGLETLTAMKTLPADWGLTAIKWVTKVVKCNVWVECPKCEGHGTLYTVNGQTLTVKAALKAVGAPEGSWAKSWLKAPVAVAVACSCPWVRPTRTGRLYFWEVKAEGQKARQGFSETYQEQGFVKADRMVEREVGIVQWHPATKFDSRFAYRYGQNHKECELCAKAIPSNRFIPVTGKGQDGTIHGMWIGEDCARKFFGVKNFKKDQVIERPEAA